MSITLESHDGVATVRIDRPERRNALTVEMREQLVSVFNGLAQDEAVRAVVLTGAGDAFCAGVDAAGMGGRDAAASRARLRALQQSVLAIYSIEKPVVAAVHGACVGVGWSLALACDQVVASDTAFFSQVFGRMALAPDGGSAWFLANNIGMLRAKELIYSCRRVPADEARSLGVVKEVTPAAELQARSHALATELARGPTMALGLSKKMLHASFGLSLEQFLETELLMQTQLTQSADYREGVAAFKEKRPPKFSGR